MAQQFTFDIANAIIWIDDLAIFIFGDRVDGQVTADQVLFQCDVG